MRTRAHAPRGYEFTLLGLHLDSVLADDSGAMQEVGQAEIDWRQHGMTEERQKAARKGRQ